MSPIPTSAAAAAEHRADEVGNALPLQGAGEREPVGDHGVHHRRASGVIESPRAEQQEEEIRGRERVVPAVEAERQVPAGRQSEPLLLDESHAVLARQKAHSAGAALRERVLLVVDEAPLHGERDEDPEVSGMVMQPAAVAMDWTQLFSRMVISPT